MGHIGFAALTLGLWPSRGGRMHLLARRLALVLPLVLVAAALGCREDAESPSAPEPTPELATTPTAVPAFRQVSAGGVHSCGVTSDDRAYCWGNNGSGQLGDGTTVTHLAPVAVAGGHRFLLVSAGSTNTCGLATDFRAFCWGENFYGQLGDGTTTNRSTPVAVSTRQRFRHLRTAGLHVCGVTASDEAFCWGLNRWGQVGDGSTVTSRRHPQRVAGGLRWRRVIAGGLHTCGVTTDDKAYCWGYGGDGQIGDGDNDVRRTPVAVVTELRFRQVTAGTSSSCGVTRDDRAYCWGANSDGRLGDGTTTSRFKPVAVKGGLRFSGVSPAGPHTCGVTSGHVAYCWGDNITSQLGDGTTTRRLTPVAVAGGLRFGAVSTGSFGQGHTCGTTTGNVAYCWGANFFGQLGDGTTTGRSTPVPVAGAI